MQSCTFDESKNGTLDKMMVRGGTGTKPQSYLATARSTPKCQILDSRILIILV